MTQLVLIRHAQVRIDPNNPVETWSLSPEGYETARRMGRQSTFRDAVAVYSSPEPKAVATAKTLLPERDIMLHSGLGELDRSGLGWVGSEEEYRQVIRGVLSLPSRSIRGCERAVDALARFLEAIDSICVSHQDGTVLVVSHGIVLTLYVSHVLGTSPDIGAWETIAFPDVAIVDSRGPSLVQPFGWEPTTPLLS